MEKSPWWTRIDGPFATWQGPIGVKEDGGGSIRGRGRIGKMLIHRAVCNRDVAAIMAASKQGEDVNEVEAAGNTPLHNAAFEGWSEGVELLLNLGAKINASNNAGDRAWHWAQNMGHTAIMKLLEKVNEPTNSLRYTVLCVQNGASTERGPVLVQEHVPKVKDFYEKECWQHHPKPYADFMEWRQREDKRLEEERKKIVRV